MKYTPIFILLFAAAVFGQTTFEPTPLDELQLVPICSITTKNSPTLRGLKLETTRVQAQKAFPIRSIRLVDGDNLLSRWEIAKIKSFSDVKEGFVYISKVRKPSRLSFISFVYKSDDLKWRSIQEFAKSVTKSLDLPYNTLVFKEDSARMDCDGWSLILGINSVTLVSSELTNDRYKLEQMTRKAFRP